MKALRIARQSFRSIGRNKGRSFLTMLGIIIGIASVISLVAIGNGAKGGITKRISQLGTNVITVRSGAAAGFGAGAGAGVRVPGAGGGPGGGARPSGGGESRQATLTTVDLAKLNDNAESFNLSKVSGYTSDTATLNLIQKDSQGNVQQKDYSISGTDGNYFDIQQLSVANGRSLTKADVDGRAKVVVLGDTAKKELLGDSDAIGKTVTFENQTYTVIGVLTAKTESGFNNPNAQLYIPFTSLQDTFAKTNLNTIYATASSDDKVADAKTSITNALLLTHTKTTDSADFNVTTAQDLLNTANQTTSVFTTLLGGIAGISLVVGGIGIMNIMLVAVTERTREIGLRKAVGAHTSDILWQFLLESVILCVAGGIIGILIGAGTAPFLGQLFRNITPEVTSGSVILAVSVSTLVGLVFGIYPAAKAARLDPIEALRYE
jgi:putative ABC transport system permease protein